jgi:hypothetical protein
MNSADMIKRLREMQSQVIHGTSFFGDVADRLEEFELAKTCQKHLDEHAVKPGCYTLEAETKIRSAFPEINPSGGHDLIDELIGLLRVARGQRDAAEQDAIAVRRTCDAQRDALKVLTTR